MPLYVALAVLREWLMSHVSVPSAYMSVSLDADRARAEVSDGLFVEVTQRAGCATLDVCVRWQDGDGGGWRRGAAPARRGCGGCWTPLPCTGPCGSMYKCTRQKRPSAGCCSTSKRQATC